MKGMNEQLERLYEMKGYWYSSLDGIVSDLKDGMFEVEDVCAEWIDAWGEGIGGKDVLYTLKLVSVAQTIIITDISFKVY